MEKYGDNDFVVDDDIVKKSSSIIYEIHDKTFSNKTSDKLLKPFNPSKPFKIRCAVTFNSLNSNTLNTAFIIVKNGVNLTCCKANNNAPSNVNHILIGSLQMIWQKITMVILRSVLCLNLRLNTMVTTKHQ